MIINQKKNFILYVLKSYMKKIQLKQKILKRKKERLKN